MTSLKQNEIDGAILRLQHDPRDYQSAPVYFNFSVARETLSQGLSDNLLVRLHSTYFREDFFQLKGPKDTFALKVRTLPHPLEIPMEIRIFDRNSDVENPLSQPLRVALHITTAHEQRFFIRLPQMYSSGLYIHFRLQRIIFPEDTNFVPQTFNQPKTQESGSLFLKNLGYHKVREIKNKIPVSVWKPDNPQELRKAPLVLKEIPFKNSTQFKLAKLEGDVANMANDGFNVGAAFVGYEGNPTKGGKYWLTSRFHKKGDLWAYTKSMMLRIHAKQKTLDEWEADVRKITYRLLLCVASLHQAGYLHHDIKPENIFVNDRGEATLGDFGGALAIPKDGKGLTEDSLGTEEFRSPEVAASKPFTELCDMWSVGMTTWSISVGNWIGSTPYWKAQYNVMQKNLGQDGTLTDEKIREFHTQGLFKGSTVKDFKFADKTRAYTYRSDGVPYLFDFLLRCMQPERRRISVREALELPWFQPDREAEAKDHQALADQIVGLLNNAKPIKHHPFTQRMIVECLLSVMPLYEPFSDVTHHTDRPKRGTISQEDREKIFHLLDKDHDGKISLNEFIQGLPKLSHRQYKQQALVEIFHRTSSDPNSRFLTYHDFCGPLFIFDGQDAGFVFDFLDHQKKGYLTVKDLEPIKIQFKDNRKIPSTTKELIESFRDKRLMKGKIDVYEMLRRELDKNEDGVISRQEWVSSAEDLFNYV